MGCCGVLGMSEVIFDSNKHKVEETSKQAYKEIKEDGTEMSQVQQVKKGLRSMGGEATINELGHEACANLENGTISARLNKLKEKGIVQDFPNQKRKDKYSNKKNKPWRLMVVDKPGKEGDSQ